MKKAIPILLLALTASANAAICTLPDGSTIQNCEHKDPDANVLIRYTMPTERVDNSLLPRSELASATIHFHKLEDGRKWETTVDAAFDAVYVYKPIGKYEVFGRVKDTGGRWSGDSVVVTKEILDPTLPPPPTDPANPMPMNIIEVLPTTTLIIRLGSQP